MSSAGYVVRLAALAYDCHERRRLPSYAIVTPFRKGRRNMKTALRIGIVVLLAAGLGATSPAAAEGQLDRLESGIRTSNGPSVVAVATAQRVYLGAGPTTILGGVRVLSVSSGGPADRAGLQAQDLVVGAAGRKIGLLSELSAILNGLNPGDRLSLEFVRGIRPLRTEVVLGAAPGAAHSASRHTASVRASAPDERNPSRRRRAKRCRPRALRRSVVSRPRQSSAARSPQQPAGPDRAASPSGRSVGAEGRRIGTRLGRVAAEVRARA